MLSSKTAMSSLGAIGGINPRNRYLSSCVPPTPPNHQLTVHHHCAPGVSPDTPRDKPIHHHHDVSNNSDIEIELEWFDETDTETDSEPETDTKQHKAVRFDPSLDWTMETEKSEHGRVRRMAEREIKKRLTAQKRLRKLPHLSRLDRQREAFFHICYSDVDLLVHQYVGSTSVVLPRMFDRLFDDANITEGVNDPRASFVALQRRYRRLCQDTTAPPPGRSAEQALFFIHWLSPVFGADEKEVVQRRVFSAIVGDPWFEVYLNEGEGDSIEDLHSKVALFFETVLSPVPIDLAACFAVLRGDHCCHWAGGYESLTAPSKRVLFWIGTMPAFRAYHGAPTGAAGKSDDCDCHECTQELCNLLFEPKA